MQEEDSERNSVEQARQGPDRTRQPLLDGRQASSPARPPRRSPQRGPSSSAGTLPPKTYRYSTPTSSFAGGRSGTPIFEPTPGGGGGDALLRAHHDAIEGGHLVGAARHSASKCQGLSRNQRECSYTTTIVLILFIAIDHCEAQRSEQTRTCRLRKVLLPAV